MAPSNENLKIFNPDKVTIASSLKREFTTADAGVRNWKGVLRSDDSFSPITNYSPWSNQSYRTTDIASLQVTDPRLASTIIEDNSPSEMFPMTIEEQELLYVTSGTDEERSAIRQAIEAGRFDEYGNMILSDSINTVLEQKNVNSFPPPEPLIDIIAQINSASDLVKPEVEHAISLLLEAKFDITTTHELFNIATGANGNPSRRSAAFQLILGSKWNDQKLGVIAKIQEIDATKIIGEGVGLFGDLANPANIEKSVTCLRDRFNKSFATGEVGKIGHLGENALISDAESFVKLMYYVNQGNIDAARALKGNAFLNFPATEQLIEQGASCLSEAKFVFKQLQTEVKNFENFVLKGRYNKDLYNPAIAVLLANSSDSAMRALVTAGAEDGRTLNRSRSGIYTALNEYAPDQVVGLLVKAVFNPRLSFEDRLDAATTINYQLHKLRKAAENIKSNEIEYIKVLARVVAPFEALFNQNRKFAHQRVVQGAELKGAWEKIRYAPSVHFRYEETCVLAAFALTDREDSFAHFTEASEYLRQNFSRSNGGMFGARNAKSIIPPAYHEIFEKKVA